MMLKAEATSGAACSSQPPLIIHQLHPQIFLPLAGFDLPPVAGAGSRRRVWPRHGWAGSGVSCSCWPPAAAVQLRRGANRRQPRLRFTRDSWAETARRKRQLGAGCEKTAAICKRGGKTDGVRRGRLGFAFLQRGSFYPGIFCLSLFFPLKFRILSEKPFREVSAEPAPNQPGSRWLAGREMLSGKQSYENL